MRLKRGLFDFPRAPLVLKVPLDLLVRKEREELEVSPVLLDPLDLQEKE